MYAQATFTDHLDYWTKDNRDAYYPKTPPPTAGVMAPIRTATCRLPSHHPECSISPSERKHHHQLELNPVKNIISRIGLQKIQVFATGENLLTRPSSSRCDPFGGSPVLSFGRGKPAKLPHEQGHLSSAPNVTL